MKSGPYWFILRKDSGVAFEKHPIKIGIEKQASTNIKRSYSFEQNLGFRISNYQFSSTLKIAFGENMSLETKNN